MTNINPIRFGIAGNSYYKNENKEDLAKNTDKNQKAAPEAKKSLESNTVLGFMAAQNTDLVPAKQTKKVDVTKYVNAEQASSIESFIKGFEADFNEISQTALNEFPDLSKSAADSIALAYINSAYEK